jgi:hypothetical protein
VAQLPVVVEEHPVIKRSGSTGQCSDQ